MMYFLFKIWEIMDVKIYQMKEKNLNKQNQLKKKQLVIVIILII